MKRESKKLAGELVTQILASIGAGIFIYGVGLAWRPGGWMVAGLSIAAPATLVAYGNYRGKN